jgi:hypothetical protein
MHSQLRHYLTVRLLAIWLSLVLVLCALALAFVVATRGM